MASYQSVARAILGGGDLDAKLATFDLAQLADEPDDNPVDDGPARAARLAIHRGADPLPRLSALTSVEARGLCLHRFANHELQAVELFAWAVLRYPHMPASFRRGLLSALVEEQAHLRMYLDRMAAHGVELGDVPLNANFWEHAPRLREPVAFLCAMGLTFESANLDFSILYRDGFARAGAADEAAVMDRVHRDELGHVAWSLSWFRRLREPGLDDLAGYQRHTPFPLGLHRAKGRNFLASARRAAGMDDALVEAMRTARSPQQDASLRPWSRDPG